MSKKPEDEIKKGLPSNKGRGEDNITIGTVHGNKNEKKKNCCWIFRSGNLGKLIWLNIIIIYFHYFLDFNNIYSIKSQVFTYLFF